MISINNISIQFGGNYLFDNVTFTINKTDRIGLIGRNGSGKSTLLRLISGIQTPETGTVTVPSGVEVGYLPQEMMVESSRPIKEETASALKEIKELEASIERMNKEIASRNDYESPEYTKLVEDFSTANDRYRNLGGHSIDADIEKILIGLGFKRDEFQKPYSKFSGGWQMRVELAKILIRRPECILLDEPTNHLDIESIRWLENFLKNYEGAVILVSHDRSFLDAITNRTIEISLGKIFDLNLKFSDFVVQRDEERKRKEAAYKNQQKKIAETERFIERFRSKATLATRVQSRVKQLEKLERIELEETDVKELNIRFPEPPRSSRLIAQTSNLSKSFGPNLVLDSISFEIERGERLAFVGKNGEGKSTLSRILAGLEEYDGKIEYGTNLETGYFAQHQAQTLDDDLTVFEVIDNAATGDMRSRVRHLLGAFLFSGDAVEKKVKVLSGGEKSRLALAKLLLKPVNFLIMDEPTNHLDMLAKDVLKYALKEFNGTLIIVSHDRDFLRGLTTRTLQFKDRKTIEYPGDIDYFLEKLDMQNLNELEQKTKEDRSAAEARGPGEAQLSRELRKSLQREEAKIGKKVSSIESEMENIRNQMNELEELFADPDFFSDNYKSSKAQKEHESLSHKLASFEEEWLLLHEEIEEIREKLKN
ncbi:MAG: ABC-F family ATP-binding cassette domain-containing protein [Candidatus Kapaibacterium sp.]